MKNLVTSTAIAALASVAASLAAFPAYAAPTVINACGPITMPGVYTLGSSILSPGGTCIDVQASGVKLFMDGFTIEAEGLDDDQMGIKIDLVSTGVHPLGRTVGI